MKIYCPKCQKATTFEYHTPPKDADTKAKYDDKSWMHSCRGVRSDYRTVQCEKCKGIWTWDFATD